MNKSKGHVALLPFLGYTSETIYRWTIASRPFYLAFHSCFLFTWCQFDAPRLEGDQGRCTAFHFFMTSLFSFSFLISLMHITSSREVLVQLVKQRAREKRMQYSIKQRLVFQWDSTLINHWWWQHNVPRERGREWIISFLELIFITSIDQCSGQTARRVCEHCSSKSSSREWHVSTIRRKASRIRED